MKYQIKHIKKSYADLVVLDGVSINFEKYKTTCILGQSGSGKTTLLNIIANMIEKDSGEINGFDNKNVSFVFQEDRLIKWKNVNDNISFVLKAKMSKEEIDKVINEYLHLLGLEKYKHYYPNELSQGMRQRISILRAFIYPAKILIMDEPFKSLDITNKQIVIDLFNKLQILERRTCILVTHDVDEAIALGDKIVIFSNKPTTVNKVVDNIPSLDKNDKRKVDLKELIENKLINLV